jgi:TetR/AcrR family transcriptional regulator, cholesterol catabolism regulator
MRSRTAAQPKASESTNSPTPREAIIDVAVRLFGEKGYNATTMRDIAKAVGILPGSLYAHIDSKETLLIEIVEKGIERFLAIDRLLAASAESPEARMRIAIREHVKVVAENPERTLVVFHQWRFLSGPNRARAIAMRRRYAKAFMKIVNEGIANGDFNSKLDARLAVFGVLGALNWTPEWYSPSGPMSAEEIGQKMADSLINGLRPSSGRVASAETGEALGRKRALGAKGASSVAMK